MDGRTMELDDLRAEALAKLERSVAATEDTDRVIAEGGDWQASVAETQAHMRAALEAVETFVMAGGAHVIAGGDPKDAVPLYPVAPKHDPNWWFRAAFVLAVVGVAMLASGAWG